MTVIGKRWMAILAVVSVNIILFSCSTTETGSKPGTPAFYWAAARETYAAGDFQKTVEHLSNIVGSQNEYVARAEPWLLVLTSGMAQGYMDLAEAYDAGGHVNRAQTSNFRRQVTTYRGAASTLAMQFAETLSKFPRDGEYVPLAFGYPTGSPTEVVLLNKITGGAWLPESEMETAQKRAIEHAVVLATCRAAGAKNDPAKAADMLKPGDAKVARATFMQAMATTLFEASQLYTHNKMDQPEKMKIFCTRAEDTLKQLPSSKDSADLDKKIQTALKKAKG